MYLRTIERALEDTQYRYAVDNVWRVCRDILQDEELTSNERTKMKGFKERFGNMSYMHPYTGQIDSSKLSEFRDLGMVLIRYIYNDLGLD